MNDFHRLHFYYRSTGGDNKKGRPPYYSKETCLRSFLRAQARVASCSRVTFVNDGPIPGDRLRIMWEHGTILPLSGIGNTPCHRETLRHALASESELVYFAEDDYLYVASAFEQMIAAFDALPGVDYVTLYDHTDRYRRRDDARRGRSRIFLTEATHWRTVESTCMTFGARRPVLASDRWIHALPTRKPFPADRRIWRMTQGIGPYFWLLPKRTLVGPMPGLATHMDPDQLSPFVDWESEARRADDWSGAKGI